MVGDKRQIRTTNNHMLLGYRAQLEGRKYIAIMKGDGKVLDIISLEELITQLSEGPYISLDKIE